MISAIVAATGGPVWSYKMFRRSIVGLPRHLLLPLVSAILYVVGALFLKCAADLGADV